MKVIQVKSKKGGVGKSLYAREIALILAALGCSILLIDGSEQANDDILENQGRAYPYTLKECLINGVSLSEAARQVRKRLWLVVGTRDHEDINEYIRKQRYPNIFKDMVEELRATLVPAPALGERFAWWNSARVPFSIFHPEPTSAEEFVSPPPALDYVLLDSDASTEDDLTFALWDAVDGILVPYELTELDWQSYHQFKQDLEKRYRRRPQQQPPLIGILPNKVLHTKDNPTPMVYLKTLFRDTEERVYRPTHWSKVFGECLNLHIGSLEHPAAATDRAIRETCAIALEFIGYEGELVGLKICEKCREQVNLAMQEREEHAS